MALFDRIQPARKKKGAAREGDRTPLERMFWRSIAIVGGFSMVINLLNMVIPLYSMQVFDRVLSSRSVDTLALLTLGIAIVLLFIASMEQLRSRVLIRVGTGLDLGLGGDLFAHVVGQAARGNNVRGRPLRDLHGLRGFLTGSGPFALIDFMWAPVYIGVVFVFDIRLGMVACGGAVVLILIAVANEAAARISVDRSEESQNRGIAQEETYVRNAEAMEAMGMTPAARQRWQADQSDALYWEGQASRRVGTSTTLSHFIRLAMQVTFIGVGAYLVLSESITIGIMVASMILGMRGLAPFDGAVAAWRSWSAARHSFERLNRILLDRRQSIPAPLPRGRGMEVTVDRLVFAPPGSRSVLFKGFSFKAGPGQIISIAGFNGVGKTALLKLMMGIWVPGSGSVKLDEVEAARIERGDVGSQIGYLSQNPFLFPGTIAENIARLGNADMRDIIQAAELAGAHKFIIDLADGYDTRVERGGRNLSGGQRQLIALAAALFGKPRLLMLDEPTTALDDMGVEHISRLINIVRKAGITTFIVSHEREILMRADAILALANGQIRVVPVRGRLAGDGNVPDGADAAAGPGAMPVSAPVPPQMGTMAGAGLSAGSDSNAGMDDGGGQMRITPQRVAIPNPDAPRPIVERNLASMPMPGPQDTSRAAAAKALAGIDVAPQPADAAPMVARPTPGGTMMTMRPAMPVSSVGDATGNSMNGGGLSNRRTARQSARQSASLADGGTARKPAGQATGQARAQAMAQNTERREAQAERRMAAARAEARAKAATRGQDGRAAQAAAAATAPRSEGVRRDANGGQPAQQTGQTRQTRENRQPVAGQGQAARRARAAGDDPRVARNPATANGGGRDGMTDNRGATPVARPRRAAISAAARDDLAVASGDGRDGTAPRRGERPQLRVVEGSAGRRRGGA